MPAVFEHLHTVTEAEIDRLGHANNLEYLRWMLDAAVAHSAAQGWPAEAYERLGAGFVVRSHQVKYLQSAYAGDELAIVTWVADFKRMSSVRRYKVVRRSDTALLASAATEWAFVNMTTRTLARIPPELAAAFEIVADPGI
jgi:acyl-CoA thioester hydrolase